MAGRNMEITVAKTAGFCFGVKRAVEKVYDQIATGKKQIYTYGPIIHNEEVVQDLEEKGVQVINSKEELEALKEGVVVIRSHGVGREIYELLERQGRLWTRPVHLSKRSTRLFGNSAKPDAA